MKHNKSALQIAAGVFKALPHVNELWIDEKTQHHYLYNQPGTVLIERSKLIYAQPVDNAAQVKPNEAKASKKRK